jgi:hypothetical protein
MTPKETEELKKRLNRLELHNKNLLEEIEVKNKAMQILIIAGHVDKERLEQATELAGGI